MKQEFELKIRDMSKSQLVDLITRYNGYVQNNQLQGKGILPIDYWAEVVKDIKVVQDISIKKLIKCSKKNIMFYTRFLGTHKER